MLRKIRKAKMNFWYTMSVDYIRDLLPDICLVGAAALTSLLAATVCGRWLLRGAAAVRPYLLAFLVFAAVAMNFAQKSGTNEPPRSGNV